MKKKKTSTDETSVYIGSERKERAVAKELIGDNL